MPPALQTRALLVRSRRGRPGPALDRSPAGAGPRRSVRSWPLLVLAAPGCGGSVVRVGQDRAEDRVRPGRSAVAIWPALHMDTAITLPVGVEAYALRAWLARDQGLSTRTRQFAKLSAIFSFALGMAGQLAYHLMAQAGMARAPWRSPRLCPACRSWSLPWSLPTPETPSATRSG